MRSQWYDLKPAVLALRRRGKSLSFIETNLGIPRSTLSGWCKNIPLSDVQRQKLADDRLIALSKARRSAAISQRAKKEIRHREAEDAARQTLATIQVTPPLIELALAMLYWGESKKTQTTALGCADPHMLTFFLAALRICYNVTPEEVTCDLHLRQDQDSKHEVEYWSRELGVPVENFKRVYFDKRTRGTTYSTYHSVCLVQCHDIAIQRKLVYLYKSFLEKITRTVGD